MVDINDVPNGDKVISNENDLLCDRCGNLVNTLINIYDKHFVFMGQFCLECVNSNLEYQDKYKEE